MPVIRKVQKPVPGLAKFLGAESQGVLAMESSNLVQPVIEVEDYLSPNPYAIVFATKTAVGQDLTIPVPDKKFFRWKWAGITIDDSVAGTFTLVGLYLYRSIGGVTYEINLGPWDTTNLVVGPSILGRQHGYGVRLKDLNGHPGDQLAARVDYISGAGNRDITFMAQYQELDL